ALSPSPASRIAAAASWTTAFVVARRCWSERSKRGKSSARPVTSGARTRSASSSSSCPVSSPSSTTIVCRIGAADTSDRHAQEGAKYDKLIRFAERLPDLRLAMGEHMTLDPLDQDRVSAIAVRLINLTWFRVGSERYVRESNTYGVTTLTKRHVSVRGKRVSFRFQTKDGYKVRTALVDIEIATAVKIGRAHV